MTLPAEFVFEDELVPGTNGDLRYFSQWGSIARNDDVVMRRTGLSRVEVVLRRQNPARPHDWASDGYRSAEEYLFWSRKVCGLACLQSLLHGWTDLRLSMGELLELALEWGCYVSEPSGTVRGLIYRPFMAWVSAQFGFHCELVEHTPIQLSAREVGPGQVLIASVSPEIREPATVDPLRGGHLVLIHAVRDGVVWFHNPSGYSGNSDSAALPMQVFERFHAGRGIVIRADLAITRRTRCLPVRRAGAP